MIFLALRTKKGKKVAMIKEKNNNETEKIFINMAKSLNGNEFASFMMGISNSATKLKVIMSMPKYKFIKSALGTIIN